MPYKLPELYDEDTSRASIDTFLGINKAPRIGDGEFSDMQNLTSDYFPNLAVRPRRGKPYLPSAKNPRSISVYAGDDGLFYPVYVDEMENESGETVTGVVLHNVDSRKIHEIPLGLAPDGDKQIITMGAYLIVLPDMMYVNTKKPEDYGSISDAVNAETAFPGVENAYLTADMVVCDEHGVLPKYIQAVDPNELDHIGTIKNGEMWQQIGVKDALYRWDDNRPGWVKEPSYLRVTIGGNNGAFSLGSVLNFHEPLKVGDSVVVSGLFREGTLGEGGVTDGPHQVAWVEDYKASEGVVGSGQVIVLPGTSYDASLRFTDSDGTRRIEIKRWIPNMDMVCESGNRLFGCRYGDDGRGNFVNEIYISARGSLLRWGVGTGTDDSPMIFNVGIDGAFTGAITYDGYPTFFKERAMLRVGGYTPADFTLYDSKCLGVAPGCGKSLAIVENTLYYKSRGPVMAFDGSMPVPVSDKLGSLYDLQFAVGGACGRKYYVSMRNYGGKKKHLYVLDTTLGLWHREDALYADSMAEDGDNMYIASLGEVWHVRESDLYQEAAGIPWYAESGIIGLENPDKKYLTKLSVRLRLEPGASARVSVQYDSSNVWKQVWATVANSLRTVTVPVLPIRCDHCKIRIDGVGPCRIYSITKTFEAAEDW